MIGDRLGTAIRRVSGVAVWAVAAAASAACATRDVRLPTGASAPFPEFLEAYDSATTVCRGVRTLTLTMRASGRSGAQRLRGVLHAGLAAPASMRLEGLAPLVGPVFLLGATPTSSTLLLVREDLVLRDAPPAALVEAITGLAVTPDDLRAILTGCVVADAAPRGGRAFGTSWRAVDLGREATAYLRRLGDAWRIVAATIGAIRLDYDGDIAGFPRRIRLRVAGVDRSTDLTLVTSDLESNVPLDPQVFLVRVPPSAAPITLDELRERGPLRETGAPR